eukprot:GHVN01041771.1.p1 GENE.GHVN01041771.1~~GHVN01041771.1.p1  ORF type:complete len:227 (-),score=30.05 GHVN01041771.1:376-1056(-)
MICSAPLSIATQTGDQLRTVVDGEGKPSCTKFKVLSTTDRDSLIACYPQTGRTHQIRVHLAHMGCPILGDVMYGGPALGATEDGALKVDFKLDEIDQPFELDESGFNNCDNNPLLPPPSRFVVEGGGGTCTIDVPKNKAEVSFCIERPMFVCLQAVQYRFNLSETEEQLTSVLPLEDERVDGEEVIRSLLQGEHLMSGGSVKPSSVVFRVDKLDHWATTTPIAMMG